MCTKIYELDGSFPKDNGYVLLPIDRKGKKLPVLYMFHGAGWDGCEEWIKEGKIEDNMNKWAKDSKFSPMIIVMPRVKRKSQEGFKHFVDQFINYSNYIEKYYSEFICKGQKNTAVAGFSMGGAAALYCSFLYKSKFLHTAAFSPSEFVHFDEKESWIPWSEKMDIGKEAKAINYISYGNAESNFERVAKGYIQELENQGIIINRHGLKTKMQGGHCMSNFLAALEEFLRIDIFGI